MIFDRVWGYDFGANSNSLEVYIGYLRRKTEADGEPRLLHTVRGVGYVLREPQGRLSGAEARLQVVAPRSAFRTRVAIVAAAAVAVAVALASTACYFAVRRQLLQPGRFDPRSHDADLVRNSRRPELVLQTLQGSTGPAAQRRSAGRSLIQVVRIDAVTPIRNGAPLPVSEADQPGPDRASATTPSAPPTVRRHRRRPGYPIPVRSAPGPGVAAAGPAACATSTTPSATWRSSSSWWPPVGVGLALLLGYLVARSSLARSSG